MTRCRARSLALIAVCLLAPAQSRAASSSISVSRAEYQSHVARLASPEFGGRRTGEPGNARAARYIAECFRSAGLRPAGTARQGDTKAALDGTGYYQPFAFPGGMARGDGNRLEVALGGKAHRYRAGTEFEPAANSGGGEARGELVFAGYGIRSEDPARDDYAGIDAKGRVVLVISGAPGADPELARLGTINRKAQVARDQGAAALLVMLPAEKDAPRIGGEGGRSTGIPILVVRRATASAWLRAIGRPLADLEKELERRPRSFATGLQVSLAASVRRVMRPTANVVGLLEGRDPALRDEILVIGAHMDHLGMGGAGSLSAARKPTLHPGADDNASGTAGLLLLARSMAAMAQPPRRSILFICFSGEELGLLGSMHYVNSPIYPLARTVAMLNMDMIGRMRDNKLIVMGTGTSPEWPGLLAEANRTASFLLTQSSGGFGGSDHQSFYTKRVPVLFFLTGLHPDYHRPSDTADRIDTLDATRITEMVGDIALRIANADGRPAFAESGQTAEQGPRMRAGVSLGAVPEYGTEVVGVRLSGVRPGSPAEKAGLRAGDVIIALDSSSIANIEDFAAALGGHRPGDTVRIKVRRAAGEVVLTATLQASRR